MTATVAIVHLNDNDYSSALAQALALLGGLGALNDPSRPVTIKVGLFDPRQRHHTAVEGVAAIAAAFNRAPRIFLAESDNYCGKALDRLERFRPVFDDPRLGGRALPASLSDDPQARTLNIAGEEMALGSVLFKPHVFVSTHVLRTFTRGSILKNLFGCTPMVKKSPYHKNAIFAAQLADIFEAAGGIDLAVLDGRSLFFNASEKAMPMNILAVSRDALALEVIGMQLAGVNPARNPAVAEFARRGLGEADPEKIRVVGVSAAEFAALKKAPRALKKMIEAQPKLPGVSESIDRLVSEGLFAAPRCVEDVVRALLDRGVTSATKALVETTLKRRVSKNLERFKESPDSRAPWRYRALPNVEKEA